MKEDQTIKDKLRSYIISEFLPGESPENLQDDTPMRTSGILDSMAALRLVSFVENEFGIELQSHETDVETFDCIADIAALVQQKKAAKV